MKQALSLAFLWLHLNSTVEFRYKEDVEKAIKELHGTDFRGRSIHIREVFEAFFDCSATILHVFEMAVSLSYKINVLGKICVTINLLIRKLILGWFHVNVQKKVVE